MLLQSTINFITKVQMSMLFDDSKEKVVILEKGQYVLIKFRHNGDKYSRLGKIKEIIPVVGMPDGLPACGDSRSPFTGCRIVVDFGSTFGSCQLTIGCNEILNIRILTEEKMKELLALGSNLIITDELFDEENDLKPDEEPSTDPGTPGEETPTIPDDGGTQNPDTPSEDPSEAVDTPPTEDKGTEETPTDSDGGDATDESGETTTPDGDTPVTDEAKSENTEMQGDQV